MGFRTNSFARIWSVDNKGNYSVAKVSISRKNKETGQYDVEFQDSYVRLVGEAHEHMQNVNISEKGYPVKITSCDVTNKYDADKKKLYYNFVIFGLEDAEYGNGSTANNGTNANGSKNKKPTSGYGATKTNHAELDDDDPQLPF